MPCGNTVTKSISGRERFMWLTLHATVYHRGNSSSAETRRQELRQRRWRVLLDKILCATDLGGKEPRGPTLGERQTRHADSIYVGVLLRERDWGKEPGREGRREGRNEGGRRGGEREGEASIFLPLQENS